MKATEAVGYVRVSTKKQVDVGVSLDAQKMRIKRWCEAQDIKLLAIHEDAGISGKKMVNRPGLIAALQESVRTGCPLIVYSLTRLSRSIRDLLDIADQLDKGKADLVSLTENIDTTSPAGRMIFRMLGVISQFEREIIQSRILDAFTYMRANGRSYGKPPYGYFEKSGLVRVDKAEQTIINKMKRLKANGATNGKIARILIQNGIPTRKRLGFWTATTVRRILATHKENAGRWATSIKRDRKEGLLDDSPAVLSGLGDASSSRL